MVPRPTNGGDGVTETMDGVIATASRRARPGAAKSRPVGAREASGTVRAGAVRPPWSDRAVFTCLRALFFLLPITMLNLTGLGLDQYLFDPFDTAKMFVFRALLLVALGIWVWSLLMSGGTIRRTKFDWWVLGFVGWAALTTALSVHPATSLFGKYTRYEGFATYLGYGVLFFLSVQVLNSEGRVRSMARTICLSGLLVSLYGVMQATGHDPSRWATLPFDKGMAFSTLGNPDLLGGYIIFPLVINVAMALSEARNNWKLFHWIATFFISACWILTFVRGAWVGGVVGLGFLMVVVVRQRRSLLALDKLFLGLTGIAAVAVAVVTMRSGAGVTNVLSRALSAFSLSEGSVGSRLQIWGSALQAIWHRPLFGWGPDTFRFAFGPYRTVDYVAHNGFAMTADNAHNYILQLTTTLGVPGVLLAYGVFVAALWSGGRGTLTRGGGTADGLLRGGFLAASVGFLVYLVFGLSVVSSTSILWLTVAIMVAPRAREHVVQRPAWGAWVAWPVAAVLCVAFVGSALLLEADYYYLQSNKSGAENVEANTRKASRLNPFNETYRMGVARVATSTFNEWNTLAVQQRDAGTQDADVTRRAQSAFDAAVAAWRGALGFSRREQDSYINLAMVYNSRAELDPAYYSEAIAVAREGLRFNPATPSLKLQLALALFNSGDTPAAVAEAKAAAGMDPAYLDPSYLLGEMYVQTGDFTAAIALYEDVLRRRPGDPVATRGLENARATADRRADGACFGGRYSFALRVLRVAVRYRPGRSPRAAPRPSSVTAPPPAPTRRPARWRRRSWAAPPAR